MNQTTIAIDNNHSSVAPDPVEPDHGDLRKGLYLKRRADYQMQAHAATRVQTGSLTSASGSKKTTTNTF